MARFRPGRAYFVNALVLGATGFIGGRIAHVLVEDGVRVRALRRDGSRAIAVEGLPLEFVPGDIRRTDSLERAMRGCEIVFHSAAPYPMEARRPEAQIADAVQTMDNVLAAAARTGVRRIVYISSYTTIGLPERPGVPAGESSAYVPSPRDPLYFRMKAAMEDRALSSRAVPVVALNPTMCVGPGDAKPTTARFLLLYAKSRFPFHLPGGMDVVDVRHVARAAVTAADRGAAGERYIVAGRWITLERFAKLSAEAAGVRAGFLPVPYPILRGAARAAEAVMRLVPGGRPAPVAQALEMLRRSFPVDASKARRELGLGETDPARAIADAVAWFRERDYL